MAQIQFTPYVSQITSTFQMPTQEEDYIPLVRPRSKPKEEIQLAPLPEFAKAAPITKGITAFKQNGMDIGNMQHIVNAFEDAGISIRITSGVRPGAMTKSGNHSHHSFGNAIDITPNFAEGETGESMRKKLKENKELGQYLRDNKIGIIDETTPEVMAKTGATGAHGHIGPDQGALRNLETLLAKKGTKLESTPQFTPYIQFAQETPPKGYVRQFDLSDKPRTKDYNFDRGYNYVAKQKDGSPNPDDPEHYYDIRGYYDELVNTNHLYDIVTSDTHFPDTYKKPGHPTFSVESKYYKPGMIAGHWEGDVYRPTPFSGEDMEARQQYAETRFKNNSVSKAGAKGAYQFVPSTWNYLSKKFGVNLDINNYDDNKQMRDLYLDDLMHSDVIRTASEPCRVALAFAAYNGGIGNLTKFIEKEGNKGIDVYNTGDGIDDLPPETKNYVNFIVRGIDGNGDLTNAAFNKALPTRFTGSK